MWFVFVSLWPEVFGAAFCMLFSVLIYQQFKPSFLWLHLMDHVTYHRTDGDTGHNEGFKKRNYASRRFPIAPQGVSLTMIKINLVPTS